MQKLFSFCECFPYLICKKFWKIVRYFFCRTDILLSKTPVKQRKKFLVIHLIDSDWQNFYIIHLTKRRKYSNTPCLSCFTLSEVLRFTILNFHYPTMFFLTFFAFYLANHLSFSKSWHKCWTWSEALLLWTFCDVLFTLRDRNFCITTQFYSVRITKPR